MRLPLFAIALVGLILSGCAKTPQSGKGFYLPPGNAERGHVAFVQMQCHNCHSIPGVQLPPPAPGATRIVELGGEVTHVRSYGDLVTAIIYPSHSVSSLLTPEARSKTPKVTMPDVSATLTVAQLVDVVTFLQPQYKEIVRTSYGYGYPVPP